MNMKPFGALVAGLLLTSALTNVTHAATTTTLNDISKSYAKGEIQALVADGILHGDGTGKFNPTNSMTRQEVAVVLTNVLHLPLNKAAASKFTDVQEWAKPYVGALVTANLTTGYSDTKFGGSDKVTREQLAIFFMRAFNQEALATKLNMSTTFADDTQINDKAKPFVGLNQRIGFINGIQGTDGSFSFKPKDSADRQTVAHLAYQFYKNGTGYTNALTTVQQVADVVEHEQQAMQEVGSYHLSSNMNIAQEMTANTESDFTNNPMILHETGTTSMLGVTDGSNTQQINEYWYNGNLYIKDQTDGNWYYFQSNLTEELDVSLQEMTNHTLTPYMTLTEDADTYTLSATLNTRQIKAIYGADDTVPADAIPASETVKIVMDKSTYRVISVSDVMTNADGTNSTIESTISNYNSIPAIDISEIKDAKPIDQDPSFQGNKLPTDVTAAGE